MAWPGHTWKKGIESACSVTHQLGEHVCATESLERVQQTLSGEASDSVMNCTCFGVITTNLCSFLDCKFWHSNFPVDAHSLEVGKTVAALSKSRFQVKQSKKETHSFGFVSASCFVAAIWMREFCAANCCLLVRAPLFANSWKESCQNSPMLLASTFDSPVHSPAWWIAQMQQTGSASVWVFFFHEFTQFHSLKQYFEPLWHVCVVRPKSATGGNTLLKQRSDKIWIQNHHEKGFWSHRSSKWVVWSVWWEVPLPNGNGSFHCLLCCTMRTGPSCVCNWNPILGLNWKCSSHVRKTDSQCLEQNGSNR